MLSTHDDFFCRDEVLQKRTYTVHQIVLLILELSNVTLIKILLLSPKGNHRWFTQVLTATRTVIINLKSLKLYRILKVNRDRCTKTRYCKRLVGETWTWSKDLQRARGVLFPVRTVGETDILCTRPRPPLRRWLFLIRDTSPRFAAVLLQ